MNATEIITALRKRYPPPAWAFLCEVSNAAGANRNRSADCIAMSLWPSRGLELHGIEVKVYRGDWLRELKKPDKAESIWARCDRWWVATSPDVVQPGELPPTWGHLIVNGRGATVATEAPKLEPKPLDRNFLAALLRRSVEQSVDAQVIAEAQNKGYEAGVESQKNAHKYRVQELEELKTRVHDFEAASGIKLEWRDGKEIGEAVNVVLRSGTPIAMLKKLAGDVKNLDRVVTQMLDEAAMGGRHASHG